ncbi:hypothetical protein FA95DRAFT_1557418 [Auriscalpium vulgare]|uniref:Uncharacterized protein n=1 Tax=Auriscalpium vulgare TaxID=40419 RepID=A0ACB8RYT9_9AGAM|nr:hypothetical protein FA95DRAFT_1557418 [Auriscalpium vulgare]
MPRRSAQAALATPAASTPRRDASAPLPSDDPFHPELTLLRRHWKWAAFSQFFYTFSVLFAMPDVSITDIEDDLTRSTSLVLPRVMLRLLLACTQDRKLTLGNWQTVLRKQYWKRNPDLNPIGPEPVVQLPTPSPESESDGEHDDEPKPEPQAPPPDAPHDGPSRRNTPSAAAESNFTVSRAQTVQHEAKTATVEPVPQSSEESRDWLQLGMLEKLDSLHLLTEWQFHNVHRFRTTVKSDDETATWRIEPIGYDAKTNAYWLIGPDRLWIQRAAPKPPRNHKRKRPATKPAPKSKRAKVVDSDDAAEDTPTSKKRKVAPAAPKQPPATPPRTTRGRRQPLPAEETPTSGRGPRAAKLQANKKLDAQAKELAELQRQATLENRRPGRWAAAESPSPRKITGTRASARLRGMPQEDVWQDIPEEWLDDGEDKMEAEASGSGNHSGEKVEDVLPKTGLESDDDAVSALTELSDDSPPATTVEPPKEQASKGKTTRKSTRANGRLAPVNQESAPVDAEPEDVDLQEEAEQKWRPPEDFVEWETICVTLYEWEHICERFEGATHFAEKALYKLLSNHIVPEIVNELRDIDRKRRLEEAVIQRKRSSRIAVKESEKEAVRQAAVQKAEESEKQGRARRLEARLKREEDERQNRETAREKRRMEREEREERIRQKRERDENLSSKADTPIDVVGDDKPSVKAHTSRPTRKAATKAGKASSSTSGSRTPAGEDWILDCEICHRTGINVTDSAPLLCCGKCSKWQHIACHDYADRSAGRPKRNWDVEEFICRNCQLAERSAVPSGSMPYATRPAYPSYPQHNISGLTPYGAVPPPAPDPRYASPAGAQPRQSLGLTFSHYQPQQRGFSTTHTSQAHAVAAAQYAPPPNYGPDAMKSATQYPAHMRASDQVSPPQYVPRGYATNGIRWSHSPAPAPPQPTVAPGGSSWPAPPVNGYMQYSASAERSSAGPPTYPPVNGPGGAPPPGDPYWQRPPHAYVPAPALPPISNQFPPEQYHYSINAPPQHRAP